MKTKKNDKANLEKNRFTFLLAGLAITLALVYTAMEWTSAQSAVNILVHTDMEIDDEYVAINTVHTPPPPPPPPKRALAEIIEIIDNEEDDPDEKMIIEEEVDENTIVDISELEEPEEEDFNIPFITVEKMPEYPGGVKKLMQFIAKNIRYPNIARENGIQGRVFVRFVVTKKGEVEKISIVRGVDPSLDKEAMRVVGKLEGWIPGMQRNKPVPVWYNIPITFRLN